MKKIVVLALSLLLGQRAIAAAPATVSGQAALPLAAVVAQYSSSLSAHERGLVARLFEGDLNFSFPANQKISVRADSVVCRTGDVDITARSCVLTFGTHKRTLKGRWANELNATMVQASVPSEGAAGSIFESVAQLVCTIDPNQIKQKGGGGADCTYNPGP